MILWIAISFVIGLTGALLVAQRGFYWGLVDAPNIRSSHRIPVPKGGGIGILVVFVAGAIWWGVPWTLWIPAGIVSLVSLLGDYRGISFKIRLAVQVGSAAVFSGSIFLRGLTSEAPTGLDVLLFIFGVFYITATANYYNFMDGINGIAGLTGIIAFSGVGLFGLFENKDMAWVATAFCIAAACLGFLPLNFPRAKVFLGDVGSVLLGFLFASWILWFSQSVLEFVVLASLLFPFYIDELSTLLVRIKEREKLTQAHRRHIYQILVNQAGLSHAVVTMCYGIIQILVAVSAWLMMRKGFLAVAVLLVVLSVLFFFGAMRIRRSFKGNGIGQFDVI